MLLGRYTTVKWLENINLVAGAADSFSSRVKKCQKKSSQWFRAKSFFQSYHASFMQNLPFSNKSFPLRSASSPKENQCRLRTHRHPAMRPPNFSSRLQAIEAYVSLFNLSRSIKSHTNPWQTIVMPNLTKTQILCRRNTFFIFCTALRTGLCYLSSVSHYLLFRNYIPDSSWSTPAGIFKLS